MDLADREQYQREMRRANEVMDQMRREDPAAWQEYVAELRTPSWVQPESVRAISVQRVAGQVGRARPETVAEVRNRVINFLRDW